MQATSPEATPHSQQEAVDRGLVRGPQSWWGAESPRDGASSAPSDAMTKATQRGLLKPDPRN